MATPPVTDTGEMLETHDIQGLVVRAYGDLAGARFLLLHVADAEKARAYLAKLEQRINRADESPSTSALQIAFTAAGLARLGVPEHVWKAFSREFTEGMDRPERSDALGDRDRNDPARWEWGRSGNPVHAMLMIYAHERLLAAHVASERAALHDAFVVVHEKTTHALYRDKEHFGFRDGLSMPKIAGVPPDPERAKKRKARPKKREWWTTPIPAGEFVLGYRNDYGVYTERPTIALADDPHDVLPLTPDGTQKDLGRNGSYLVYREMTQDVHAFWTYLATSSREEGADTAERAIALGAKMVGRWPGGAPLVTSKTDDPAHAEDNLFKYAGDKVGLACPRGAHIRRANPRDVLAIEDRSATASELMVRKHQMVRRGRPFGAPVDKHLDPRKMLASLPDRERRGLHFMCLVGDINRQFEFVQRAWIHSGNFDSMYRDGDPIAAGRRAPGSENPNDQFTCPAVPVRRTYAAMPQFTTLVGGGYFFLPGLAALRYIARGPGGAIAGAVGGAP